MAINLRDYSKTAAQRGWGAGWPSCSGARNNLVIVTADVSGCRVSVHSRIARLVDMLLDETERRGFLCKKGQTGAYNCRPIGGTNSPSNHSWGLAVDINWQDNPYTTNPKSRTIPDWMVVLWNRYGFAWGGHYSGSKKDYMHFEFMGSPADADAMTALALREIGGPGQAISPVAPVPGPATPAPRTTPRTEELAMQPVSIAVDVNNFFRAACRCEQGATSAVFSRAWVTLGSTWGSLRNVKITFLAPDGKVLSQWRGDVPNNNTRVVDPPVGVAQVTWEGTKDPNAILTPTVIYAPK